MSSNIRLNKVCKFCGGEFIARTTVTRYCSDNCAKRAYKKRKRQEKIGKAEKSAREPIDVDEGDLRKQFLNIAETARLLGVSRWTVQRMVTTNQLKSIKFGRKRIIRRADIDNLFI